MKLIIPIPNPRFCGTQRQVLDAIVQAATQQAKSFVRRCAGCYTFFVVSRKDKYCCSQSCQIAKWKRDLKHLEDHSPS